MKKEILIVLALALFTAALPVFAGQSGYATGTSSAAVTFGPSGSGYVLKGLYAKSDKAASVVKIYGRGGAGRVPVTAAPTNGATVIAVSNIGYGLTNADVVVYCHSNGSYSQTTVSGATTTNVTLAAAISTAGTTSDILCEVTQQFQIAVGTNSVSEWGDAIYYSPRSSPVYLVLDGTSACSLGATVAEQ